MATATEQGQIGPDTYSNLAKQLFGKEPAMPTMPEVPSAPAPAAMPKQESLSSALNLNMGNMPKTSQDVLQKRMEIAPELGASAAGLESAKMGVENQVLAGRGQEQERYGQNVQAGMDKFQEDKKNWPLPEFHPTRENAQSIGELFSMVATFGVMLGAGAKGSAQAAMASMTGMLEGWKKGRKDLYERELKEFEKNFQRMRAVHEDMRKDFEDYLKLAVNDRDAAMLKMEAMTRKAGQSSIATQLLKTGQLKQFDEMLQGAERLLISQENKALQIKLHEDDRKAADARAADERSQRAAQHTETIGLQKERLQFDKDKEEKELKFKREKLMSTGNLPKDTKTNDEHRFRFGAIENVREVLDELNKPEVRRLIGPQNQFTPAVLLNFQKGFPELAQKLARFQAEEFKIGGKSLTQSEQKILGPIYNWRGLTAEALQDNLREAERAMDKEQSYLENRYPGFKELNYRGDTPRTSTSNTQSTSTSKYKIDQIIEIKGKKYKVTGLSDPNNPDIEEVK